MQSKRPCRCPTTRRDRSFRHTFTYTHTYTCSCIHLTCRAPRHATSDIARSAGHEIDRVASRISSTDNSQPPSVGGDLAWLPSHRAMNPVSSSRLPSSPRRRRRPALRGRGTAIRLYALSPGPPKPPCIRNHGHVSSVLLSSVFRIIKPCTKREPRRPAAPPGPHISHPHY